jgi:uncharacterized protein YpmB
VKDKAIIGAIGLVILAIVGAIMMFVPKQTHTVPEYNEMHRSQAFDEGVHAGELGQPTQANPYSPGGSYGSIRKNAWAAGWLKGDESRILKAKEQR